MHTAMDRLRALYSRSPWVGGAVVVAVALALRLAMLHTARFGGDEALFFNIAMDIVEAKSFPLLGTQITDGAGRLPGPTFLYVMALPLLIARTPEAQYAFVEILGALTVGLYWHALRRPFGERGALFAALLLALSPWSALYADRTWNPNVLPFLVVLALLAAIRLRENASSRWLAVFLPACAAMPHFHMSAPVAWAGLAVLVAPALRAPARRQWNRRALLIGIALALALYAPLLAHELSTGFANTRNILSETVGGGGGAPRHPTSFLWVPVYALRFLTLDATYHELTGYWGGPDELANLRAVFTGTTPRPFHPLRLLAFLSSLGLALLALTHALRAHPSLQSLSSSPWLRAFLAALLVNMLLLGAAGKQVFGHYVINLLPFVFIAYASLGRSLMLPSTKRLSPAAAALALIFCVGGAEVTLAISRRIDARIGLEVHRRALEKIRADGEAEGNSGEPVRLDFGFRSSHWDWNIYAFRSMKLAIRFDKRATTRVYRLVDKHKPLPADAPSVREGPVDVGHALLYRMR